jgi:hypothetical protein
MAQLFSPFTPELRPWLQLMFCIYDIEAGVVIDPIYGLQCYGPDRDPDCKCDACEYKCALQGLSVLCFIVPFSIVDVQLWTC